MLLSIIMPAYNEEKTLEKIVDKVMAVKFPLNYDIELLILNDGSVDNTYKIMQFLKERYKNKVRLFNNQRNLGKTQTVKKGLLGSKGDIVVIQDADFEYNPDELAYLLKTKEENNLDVVYGNRFGKRNKVIYWENYMGNRALSFFSSLFTYPRIKVWIPDMEVCYKMIDGDVAREVSKSIVSTSTFGLEPEITARLSKYRLKGKHLKFGVVPISYHPRSITEGKKMNAINDGLKALIEIIRFNLFTP